MYIHRYEISRERNVYKQLEAVKAEAVADKFLCVCICIYIFCMCIYM